MTRILLSGCTRSYGLQAFTQLPSIIRMSHSLCFQHSQRASTGANSHHLPCNLCSTGVLISLILPGLLSVGMEETLTETRGSKIRRQGGGLVLILFGIGIGAAGILHLAMYAGKTPHF